MNFMNEIIDNSYSYINSAWNPGRVVIWNRTQAKLGPRMSLETSLWETPAWLNALSVLPKNLVISLPPRSLRPVAHGIILKEPIDSLITTRCQKTRFSPPINKPARSGLGNMPFVLAIQDTTQRDFTHHPVTSELGRLQDRKHQGLFYHPTFLLTPEKVPRAGPPSGLDSAGRGFWQKPYPQTTSNPG